MRDSTKIVLLGVIALVFAFLFIGIGLNADNYQYFLSRRVPKVLAIVLAGDCSVSYGVSNHYA